MSVHHHLDEATLLRYASGDLNAEFAVVVATHLAMCGHCRDAVAIAEAAGGDLLEKGETVELSEDALEKIMACIDGEGSDSPRMNVRSEFSAKSASVPLPLQRHIGDALDGVAWKTVAPGVRKFDIHLPTESGSSLFMLKIAPGKKVPEHGHGGSEMTLILSGSYRDSLGHFGPGDIADLDEHVEHQPEVDSKDACICLVATEAPTRFKGVVSRLMQPFVGI